MDKKIIGAVVVALIIGVGIGYFGGNALHPATPAQGTRGSFAGTNGGTRGSANGGEVLSGTVAVKDAGSITIDTRDGSSHVVLLTPATTVQKSVSGSVSDVSVGSTIVVTGSTNSDGSISASSIQLRPAQPSATVGQ